MDTYKKNKGNTGLDGTKFQLNLITVFLLNALRYRRDWKISTENEEAKKYDDLVLELPEKSILLQAKFRKNKKVNRDQLFSTNPKNADFSLPKYFFSYLEIKTEFTQKTVAICTNTNIDEKGLEKVLTCDSIDSNNLLHHEGNSYHVFKFNKNILPDLKNTAEIYLEKNLQGKGIDKTVITNDNMVDFLNSLQIFSNYPCGDKLDNVIEQLLSRLNYLKLCRKVSSQEIYKKVEDWFQQARGEYLTEARANAMFCEIRSDKYCKVLKDYNMSFKHKDFNFSGTNRIFHVTSERGYVLQMIKIHSTFQDDIDRKLYVNPDDDIHVQNQVVEAFELPHYKFLIIVYTKITNEIELKKIVDKLRNILEKYKYKKVILIGERNDKLSQQIGLKDIFRVDGSVTYKDLSEDSQMRLIKSKNINFQGDSFSLGELVAARTLSAYSEAIDSEILERLIREKEIKVGMHIEKYITEYYISRTFKRRNIKTGEEETIISEENISDINEKAIVIADSAGMGKSTVLTKLATIVKKKNPHHWMIRIDLNDYTTILRNLLMDHRETISTMELLNCRKETELTNHLEKFVFYMNKKVVLMLDGVDEINPDYTRLIISLLTQCKQAPNFDKIFITTRPHLIRELKDIFKAEPFVLQPIMEKHQVDFLANYWISSLHLNEKDKEKCEQYARILMRKMSYWTKRCHCKENDFVAVPLQLRMLAEIFEESIKWDESSDWEGCKEYLERDGAELKLPKSMEIKSLYDMFIKKKRDVFLYKGNQSGNSTANKALTYLFEKRLADHRSLAIKLILGEDKCHIFTSYKERLLANEEVDLLNIGIVQKLDDKFHFQHRTFAEYFLAESLLKELQYHNENAEFQRFFVERILWRPEFNLLRIFLNSFLQNDTASLPSDIFRKYQSLMCESDVYWWIHNYNPIFILSEEGCVAVLHFILKCIDFRIVRGREIKIKDFKRHINVIPRPKTNIDKGNILNVLKMLVHQGGLNIKDSSGRTPLHYAAQTGHLEMVKFLIYQGANVDSRNYDGHTALHLAAWEDHLGVVECLVKMHADINVRDNAGRTALHFAVLRDKFDTVKFLAEHGGDGNINDKDGRTALHLAALNGQLNTVNFLVKCNVDVNINDKYGRKVLHVAALSGQLNTVKFLSGLYNDINIRDNDGSTALHLAVSRDQLDTVKYLVKIGAGTNIINNQGNAPLHLAALNGNVDIIKFLSEYDVGGVCIRGNYGRTALHFAALSGHLDSVKYLVEFEVDVNITDDNEYTPLHVAALNGKLDTIKFFADHDVDVYIEDKFGRTALHLAALNGQLDAVKFLVGMYENINIKDKDGNTALHLAALSGNLETVRFIVKCGGDVNIMDRYCRTALHLAALGGKLGTVKFLVASGIDVDIVDSYGRTALHLAERSGRLDIIEFFLKQKHQDIETDVTNQ